MFSRPVGVLVVTLCALGISNTGPIYSVYPIRTPAGWPGVNVFGINNSGQVAGSGGRGDTPRAFIGATSGSTAIPLIPGWCEMYTEDFPINDAGQVVGSATENSFCIGAAGSGIR